MQSRTIVGGTTAVGVIGYGLAVLLARVTDYAERVEDRQFGPHPVARGSLPLRISTGV